MLNSFLNIVAYLIIGFSLKRVKAFPRGTGQVLNLFVIHVSLPALILLKIPLLRLSSQLIIPVFLPWLMLGFSALIVLLLARIFHWSRSVTGCLLLLVPLGNTSFFGYPMVEAFFGAQGLPFAILYDQLGSFIALVTFGSLIIALYSGNAEKKSLGSYLKKVFFFPPFFAGLIAFALRDFTYPVVVNHLLESLAITLVPTVMIAVGFQITFKMDKRIYGPLAFGLVTKLLLAPFLALVIMNIFRQVDESTHVAIFEAGMPPMVTAGALAIQENLAPELAAALVGFGLICACLTLPFLFSFF